MARRLKLIVSNRKGDNPAQFKIEYFNEFQIPTVEIADDDGRYERIRKITEYLISLDTGYVKNYISNISSKLGNNSFTYNGISGTIPNGLYNVEQLNRFFANWCLEHDLLLEDDVSPIELEIQEANCIVRVITKEDLELNPKLNKMLGFPENYTFTKDDVHFSPEMSQLGTDRLINVHVSLIDNAYKDQYKSGILCSFYPTRYYSEMMNITPIHKTFLNANAQSFITLYIELRWDDTNELVQFDRDDAKITSLHLYIGRTSI